MIVVSLWLPYCSRLGLSRTGRAYELREIGEHLTTTCLSIARRRLGTKVYWVWVLTLVLMGWLGSFGLYCLMLMSCSTTFVSYSRRFSCPLLRPTSHSAGRSVATDGCWGGRVHGAASILNSIQARSLERRGSYRWLWVGHRGACWCGGTVMTFKVYHCLHLIHHHHQTVDYHPPLDFPPPFNPRPRSKSHPPSKPHPKLITHTLPTFGKNLLPRQAHYNKKKVLLFPALGPTKENLHQVSPFVNTVEVPASPRSKAFPHRITLPSPRSMPSKRVLRRSSWMSGTSDTVLLLLQILRMETYQTIHLVPNVTHNPSKTSRACPHITS